MRSRQAGTSCDVSSVQRLELRTSCNESLTSLVSLILLEVLDEAGSEILSLLLPLSCVSISVARIEDVGVYAVELCRNNEVEEWDSLCWSSVDRVVEDSVDDTTSVADRDTLAGTVPTSVHQVSLCTALLHLLNQLLSILCWVELQECLAEASRECRSRLSDATLCTCELCCESREDEDDDFLYWGDKCPNRVMELFVEFMLAYSGVRLGVTGIFSMVDKSSVVKVNSPCVAHNIVDVYDVVSDYYKD